MTKYDALPLSSSAVVLWLAKDEKPTDPGFSASKLKQPPGQDLEGWWFLRDAIVHTQTTVSPPGLVPWIKVGEMILSPKEISSAFTVLFF
jgi:hypothetical protein